MTLTTKFTDGSVGDTSTGESTTVSQSGNDVACNYVSPNAVLCAQAWFAGFVNTVTAFTAKVILTRNDSLDFCSAGVDPLGVPADSCVAALEIWQTDHWTSVWSGSLSLPTGVNGSTVSATNSLSQSFTSTSGCWARLTISYIVNGVRGTGSSSAQINLTDWRLTASATATGCPEGGGSDPTTGGGAGPGTVDGENTCTCDDWTERTLVAESTTERSRLSDSSTERARLSSSWSARVC